MTITSVGYDGTIDEPQWAQIADMLGGGPVALGAGDWAVTAVAGLDRTVKVGLGTHFSYGVRDIIAGAAPTVQGAIVSAGMRWDTVVKRQDWQATPGGTTTVALVPGPATTLPTVAALPNTQPGIINDVPLALVQFLPGQTAPGLIIDLRAWAGKTRVIASTQALPTNPRPGDTYQIGDLHYTRVMDAGAARWSVYDTRRVRYGPGTSVAFDQLFAGPDNINSLVIPAQPYPCGYGVQARAILEKTTGSNFEISLRQDGAEVAHQTTGTASDVCQVALDYQSTLPVSTSTTFTVSMRRLTGTGSIKSYAGATVNRLQAQLFALAP